MNIEVYDTVWSVAGSGIRPGAPVPHGSVVTLTALYRDADYEPAQPFEVNVLGEYGFERDGRPGRVRIVEEFPGVPASGGIRPSDVEGVELVFPDGRPVKTLWANDANARFEFVATSTGDPILDFATPNQQVVLPGISVAEPAPFVRKPRFGVWDGYPDQRALVGPGEGLQDATVGVDRTMRRLSGQSKPSIVNAGFRHYQTIKGARWVEDSVQANTARMFPTPTTVNCLWFHDAVAERYSTFGVIQLAAGIFDAEIRSWVASLPQDVVAYGFPLHEADHYGGNLRGLDPATYRRAIHHFLEVAVDQALRQGRTPKNFGVGGLLTGTGMDQGIDSPWAWYRDLPKWLVDSGFVVGAWDTYFLMDVQGRRENFRPKVDRHTAEFKTAGLERFFIAETAQGLDYRHQRDTIVGTALDQVHHLEQLEKWLVEEGEFAFLFSKEDGAMSRNGSISRPGRESAARKAYYLAEKMNIPVVPQSATGPW